MPAARALRGIAAGLLAGACMHASAATYLVSVGGGSPPRFAPESLTIAPGDTVVFINKGGVHNVVADDGSFRCARGCKGDAQGDTGAPSGASWIVSLKFPDPGTVGYFCELHGAPREGMFGTIDVVAPEPPPPPAPALSPPALLGLLLALALAACGVLSRTPAAQRKPRYPAPGS